MTSAPGLLFVPRPLVDDVLGVAMTQDKLPIRLLPCLDVGGRRMAHRAAVHWLDVGARVAAPWADWGLRAAGQAGTAAVWCRRARKSTASHVQLSAVASALVGFIRHNPRFLGQRVSDSARTIASRRRSDSDRGRWLRRPDGRMVAGAENRLRQRRRRRARSTSIPPTTTVSVPRIMPGSISGTGVGRRSTGCAFGLKGHQSNACAGTLEPTSTVPKAAATNARRSHGRNMVRDVKLTSVEEPPGRDRNLR
jgi:hypothetical protein